MKFQDEDCVNLFYCKRCNNFLITEYNDRKNKICDCTNEFGKGYMRLLLTLDDYILRRKLEDAQKQLNKIIKNREQS